MWSSLCTTPSLNAPLSQSMIRAGKCTSSFAPRVCVVRHDSVRPARTCSTCTHSSWTGPPVTTEKQSAGVVGNGVAVHFSSQSRIDPEASWSLTRLVGASVREDKFEGGGKGTRRRFALETLRFMVQGQACGCAQLRKSGRRVCCAR